LPFQFAHYYQTQAPYQKSVAYFCMEYGIDQALKIYAGGLGFLSGSFMKSAYELKQNVIGIGILWKYGYYNQVRKQDQTMDVLFEEKSYGFLVDTEIRFTIKIAKHDVWVAAYYLEPEIFKTAPLFLLTTDLSENDYLAKTISHKLYDSNPETSIAAAILLGAGGARLLEILNIDIEVYHLNESHALPLAFYLYNKYKNIAEVKKRLVYTNHTSEEAGNKKSNITFLDKIGFFCDIPIAEIIAISSSKGNDIDHTLTALRLAGIANGVSEIHKNNLIKFWGQQEGICEIIAITNAQSFSYWHDKEMYQNLSDINFEVNLLKKKRKKVLFEIVADQCGEIYDENICTIIFAKRFAGYKRPDLLLQDMERFEKLVNNKQRPVQIIWAGKPYPMDYYGIGVFDKIVNVCKAHNNCAVLVGYELTLSKILKSGADIWLNNPRMYHEASGTSGIAAAMNGAVNIGAPDGWFPEFAKDKINSFIIPECDTTLPDHLQDEADAANLYNIIENELLPIYYDYPNSWNEIIKKSMQDIIPKFDSNRMAIEYYEKMYNKTEKQIS
jgi:glycogen phosphorylase